ncbi:MAG: hypothetical protein ACLFTK_09390 [Anaerolineales bacterium]
MTQRQVLVGIDDRIRLMSAVLAITDWPQRAQQRKGHRPHFHARNTTRWLDAFKDHPAVQAAQYLLDMNPPLEALYAFALKLSWPDMYITKPPRWMPPDWNDYLYDFYYRASLMDLWQQDSYAWQQAEIEARQVMASAQFYEFMQPFIGHVAEQLIYMPNISYPSDVAVGVRVGRDLICIGPPRIAWGDNEPWPFHEDPTHVYSSSLSRYMRLLMFSYLRRHAEQVAPVASKKLPVNDEFRRMYPNWGDQFIELFVPGSVAIYLEYKVSPQEAKAFTLMERKSRGVTILPGVVSVLQRYLNEYFDGKYDSLIEFLPYFPNHLRVAKTISAL